MCIEPIVYKEIVSTFRQKIVSFKEIPKSKLFIVTFVTRSKLSKRLYCFNNFPSDVNCNY